MALPADRSAGLRALLAWLALGLAGCGGGPVPTEPARLAFHPRVRARPAGRVRVFAIADHNVLRTAREVAPLLEYLETAAQVPLETGYFVDYDGEIEALAAGRADYAWLSPIGYVKARARIPGLDPLVRPIQQDRSTYRSVLVVRAADPATDLKGLAGRTLAFAYQDSTSGHLFPKAWLAGQGVDPAKHFGKVEFAGSHENAVLGVVQGRYDAAFVEDAALAGTGAVPTSSWRVLAVAATIPHGPLVALPSLDPDERRRMREALTGYATDPRCRALVFGLQQAESIQAFRPTTDGDYDEIRRLAGPDGGAP